MARSRGRPKLSAHRRQAGDRAPVALSRDPSPPGRCGRLRRLRSVSSRARSSIAGPDRPAPPVSAHPGDGHLRGLAYSPRAEPDHRAGFRPPAKPGHSPSCGASLVPGTETAAVSGAASRVAADPDTRCAVPVLEELFVGDLCLDLGCEALRFDAPLMLIILPVSHLPELARALLSAPGGWPARGRG